MDCESAVNHHRLFRTTAETESVVRVSSWQVHKACRHVSPATLSGVPALSVEKRREKKRRQRKNGRNTRGGEQARPGQRDTPILYSVGSVSVVARHSDTLFRCVLESRKGPDLSVAGCGREAKRRGLNPAGPEPAGTEPGMDLDW